MQFLLLITLLFPAFAPAQVQTIWQTPPGEIEVDFSSANSQRKAVFLEDGMALEVPLGFMLVGRHEVTVVADLLEPGRFELKLAGDKVQAEVKEVTTEDRRGRGEVVAKVKPLDVEEAFRRAGEMIDELIEPADRRRAEENADKRKTEEMARYVKDQGAPVPKDDGQLKELYIRARALDKSAGVLREALDTLAKEKPRWFPADEKQAIAKAGVAGLVAGYQNLLVSKLADEHLHRCGLQFDSSSKAVRDNLKPMLQATHALMSGKLADDPDAGKLVASALTSNDLSQLRQALGINLKCRFFPQTDDQDANAQWFNGQRVACRATGVSSIRVEGTLDPAKGDRVDWWLLERFDPEKTKLETSKSPGLEIDPPFVDDAGARLRVAATGKQPVSYWFEFKGADKAGQLKVIIHESPPSAAVKFPY